MLSATHTHAGPCSIHLQEAGGYDQAYAQFLQDRLRTLAKAAGARREPVEVVAVEGHLDLAIDRRRTASSHTDPRVAAVGFRRDDGGFAALVVNYAMHAVALGHTNRHISADVPGQAARHLNAQLPGSPVVFITNGACGNLNPPAENVSFEQIVEWGRQMSDAVAPLLREASPLADARLRVLTRVISLPLDVLDAAGIEAAAAKAAVDGRFVSQWGDKYRRAVEHWRESLLADVNARREKSGREGELFGVSFGNLVFVGANAEVFSEFMDWLRAGSDQQVYFIGYANGDMGYLPTRAAYTEGGYEVDAAHFFYGGFRLKAGGLELLAGEAIRLLHSFSCPPNQ
jgi:hypothetical protein